MFWKHILLIIWRKALFASANEATTLILCPKKGFVMWTHVDMTEHAVHFCHAGLSSELILDTADYLPTPAYGSGYPSSTNVVLGILNLSRLETVHHMYKLETTSVNRWLPRAEQKNIEVPRSILRKPSRPQGLVLDTCLRFRATEYASLEGSKHWKAAGCDTYRCYMEKMIPSRLKLFAEKLLNKKSDILEEDMQHAARWYLWKSSIVKCLQRKRISNAFQELRPVYIFFSHNVQFVQYIFQPHPFKKARQ